MDLHCSNNYRNSSNKQQEYEQQQQQQSVPQCNISASHFFLFLCQILITLSLCHSPPPPPPPLGLSPLSLSISVSLSAFLSPTTFSWLVRHVSTYCESVTQFISFYPCSSSPSPIPVETNEVLIVRSCSMYPLDNTCGLFKFESTRYSGCLMSCNRDACNRAVRKAGFSPGHSPGIPLLVAFASTMLRHFSLLGLL